MHRYRLLPLALTTVFGVLVSAASSGAGSAGSAPEAQLLVHVIDADGAPVADVEVEALAKRRSVTVGRTDARGTARLRFSTNADVRWILAIRPGTGLDYAAYPPPAPRGIPVVDEPREVVLTLGKARTVRIRATDSAGAPLDGVRFSPWILHSRARPESINLSASFIASVRTDADGIAVLDWLPRGTWEVAGGTLLVRSPGYHWARPPEDLYPGTQGIDLVATLRENATISGTVRFADGRPAAGVVVQAEGRGATIVIGRARARTGLDGSYSLDVAPDQSYVLAVIDERWAALRRGVLVEERSAVEGVDLTLSPGCRIAGRVTDHDGAPVVGELVLLGVERPGAAAPEALADPISALFPAVAMQRWSYTDENGEYAFRVGPGVYFLCAIAHAEGGIHTPERLVVDDGAIDLVRDFRKDATQEVIGTSGAPVLVSPGEAYEYAFHPVWRGGWLDSQRTCTQCHRPQRGGAR